MAFRKSGGMPAGAVCLHSFFMGVSESGMKFKKRADFPLEIHIFYSSEKKIFRLRNFFLLQTGCG